jgi:hypothetical protein
MMTALVSGGSGSPSRRRNGDVSLAPSVSSARTAMPSMAEAW